MIFYESLEPQLELYSSSKTLVDAWHIASYRVRPFTS